MKYKNSFVAVFILFLLLLTIIQQVELIAIKDVNRNIQTTNKYLTSQLEYYNKDNDRVKQFIGFDFSSKLKEIKRINNYKVGIYLQSDISLEYSNKLIEVIKKQFSQNVDIKIVLLLANDNTENNKSNIESIINKYPSILIVRGFDLGDYSRVLLFTKTNECIYTFKPNQYNTVNDKLNFITLEKVYIILKSI